MLNEQKREKSNDMPDKNLEVDMVLKIRAGQDKASQGWRWDSGIASFYPLSPRWAEDMSYAPP